MKKVVSSIGAVALLGMFGAGAAVWAQGRPDFTTVQAPVRLEARGPVITPQDDPPPREVYPPARPRIPDQP